MALVEIYNPASGNFAHAPESALPQMPKWRKSRPSDKPRSTKKTSGGDEQPDQNKES